jgi:hypothetical protein
MRDRDEVVQEEDRVEPVSLEPLRHDAAGMEALVRDVHVDAALAVLRCGQAQPVAQQAHAQPRPPQAAGQAALLSRVRGRRVGRAATARQGAVAQELADPAGDLRNVPGPADAPLPVEGVEVADHERGGDLAERPAPAHQIPDPAAVALGQVARIGELDAVDPGRRLQAQARHETRQV